MHIDEDCLPARLGGTLNSPDYPGHYLYQVIEHYTYRYEGINKLFIPNMRNVEYVYEKTFIFNFLRLTQY